MTVGASTGQLILGLYRNCSGASKETWKRVESVNKAKDFLRSKNMSHPWDMLEKSGSMDVPLYNRLGLDLSRNSRFTSLVFVEDPWRSLWDPLPSGSTNPIEAKLGLYLWSYKFCLQPQCLWYNYDGLNMLQFTASTLSRSSDSLFLWQDGSYG